MILMERNLEEFRRELLAEVIDRSRGEVESEHYDGTTPDFKENIFTKIFVEYLTENGMTEEPNICYLQRRTGYGNVKVNAYNIDAEARKIDLFITLFHDTVELPMLSKSNIRDACDQTLRFFKLSKTGYHDKMEQSSEQFSMIKEIYMERFNIQFIHVYLLTDGILPSDLSYTEDDDEEKVQFQYWDVKRLNRFVTSNMRDAIEIEIGKYGEYSIECLPLKNHPEYYSAYLTILPGKLLSDLYEEYGSALLELNVRSFLQGKGKVNKGIRETLKEEPDFFMAYNNGVSMTADKLEFKHDENGAIVLDRVVGLQIVNGGQTVASIHRAHRVDKYELRNVYVQAKITVIDPEKVEYMVPKITRFANSQNKVNDADFFSNDPFHIELQKLSETIWTPGEQSRWFYERTRGLYQVTKAKDAPTDAKRRQFERSMPPSQRFSKVDVAKYINAWELLPHIVSLGGQKNFTYFMNRVLRIRGKDWRPNSEFYKTLVGKAILYKTAEFIVKQNGIPSYRSNIVAYTVAYLSHRALNRIDFVEIWNKQKVSKGIEEAIGLWCIEIHKHIVESSGDRNVGEWCKKETTWQSIKSLNLEIPKALEDDFVDDSITDFESENYSGQTELTGEDYENIARVMSVDGITWYKIHSWGKTTKNLESWQCGIAYTLSGMAADNWIKKPSAKQARQGVKILELAIPVMTASENEE
jgi:hypothetical protein